MQENWKSSDRSVEEYGGEPSNRCIIVLGAVELYPAWGGGIVAASCPL